MNNTLNDELPVFFLEPNDEMLALVSAFLEGLPITSESEVMKDRRKEKPEVGDKERTIASVGTLLKRYHAEHMTEVGSVPWSFDYMIGDYRTSNRPELQGMCILTRLISPNPEDGKILYGSTVFRTGLDRFVYWLE
ncbi:hypothetical protein [Taklimakanibacter lacteus]|uniref:hypothetical protein n=1 Tax=Taklimakanibacter lacteus TaxID=2268456 RepID=UPI000E665F6C